MKTGANALKIIMVVLAAIAAAACTSVKQGVVGSTSANVEPFATETINTLSVESMEIRRNRLKRLREYYDDDTEVVNNMLAVIADIEDFRKGIAVYSLELVHITGMNIESTQQTAMLADFIADMYSEEMSLNLGVSAEEFERIAENVRAQEKFLDAVKAVNPLITVAANYHERLLRRIETTLYPAVREHFDSAVEEDFAVVLLQEDALELRRDELMSALQQVDLAMGGDVAASAALRELDVFRPSSARPAANPGDQELLEAEAYLILNLRKNAEVLSLIQPSLDTYVEAREELNGLTATVSDGIKIARFQLAAWRKAHQDLANGVKNPGKWLSGAFGVAGSII